MPIRMRSAATSKAGSKRFLPSSSTSPVARCPGYRAYMRLITRSRVDLPQPEGPMKAVMLRSGMSSVTPLSARVAP